MAEPKISKSSRVGGVTALLVLGSVGLNVFLAVQLFQHRVALPEPSAAFGSNQFPGSGRLNTPVTATNSPTDFAATNALAFHWRDIESTDYRQYIANLRAVGCPEAIIRDIITADVNQLFAARVRAVLNPQIKAYWQKLDFKNPGPEQVKQFMAIDREKGAVLQDLLGFKVSQQEMIDTLHLQLHGSEQQLLFLPPDRRAAALMALTEVDFEAREIELHSQGRYSAERERKLWDEKVAVLAGTLSPEELEEFNSRNSQTGQTLRMELEYFKVTPEEFRTLLAAREAKADGKHSALDLLNRTAATEEARKLFGDERAKEFERVTDMFYLNTRRSAEEQGVPLERIEQAWQVTRDARTAADQAAKNTSLTVEERKRQVLALRQQADARLTELLGDKASRAVRRDLRVVLGGTETSIGR